MGRGTRPKPKRLAEKLRQARESLNLSQDEMVRALKSPEEINRNYVSGYERGTREPSLLTLLAYSKLTGASMEAFVDDKLDLPGRLTARHQRL